MTPLEIALAALSAVLLVALAVVVVRSRRAARRGTRIAPETLQSAQLGAEDQLLQFRLRQLMEQIEALERRRDELSMQVGPARREIPRR